MKWYKLMLWKAYFDEGYGFTSYIKYLLGLFTISDAIVNSRIYTILIIGVLYGICCVGLGRYIFKSKMKDAMYEVQNAVNPFVRDMRKVFK